MARGGCKAVYAVLAAACPIKLVIVCFSCESTSSAMVTTSKSNRLLLCGTPSDDAGGCKTRLGRWTPAALIPTSPAQETGAATNRSFSKPQDTCTVRAWQSRRIGSMEELTAALKLIPARTELMLVKGAGHELVSARTGTDVTTVVRAFWKFVAE